LETFGKAIGIAVFVAGMALLGYVFYLAYMFPVLFHHALGSGTPQWLPIPSARVTTPSALEGMSPLVQFMAEAGVYLLTLLVLGGLAALIAHKGASLIGVLGGKKGE